VARKHIKLNPGRESRDKKSFAPPHGEGEKKLTRGENPEGIAKLDKKRNRRAGKAMNNDEARAGFSFPCKIKSKGRKIEGRTRRGSGDNQPEESSRTHHLQQAIK